tara:strand:+ start:382 stop:882 length:501 start_codon:yes stop_codon:yes gene_type:complete
MNTITNELIINTLFNLQILSSLNTNNKLSTNIEFNKLEIDTNLFPSISRYIYGYNRQNTLEIIHTILNNVYTISDYYFKNNIKEKHESFNNISNITTSKTTNEPFFIETSVEKIKELLYAMENSLPGLYKLKTTYINDNSIQIQLDMLINKMIKRINKINNAIDIK